MGTGYINLNNPRGKKNILTFHIYAVIQKTISCLESGLWRQVHGFTLQVVLLNKAHAYKVQHISHICQAAPPQT